VLSRAGVAPPGRAGGRLRPRSGFWAAPAGEGELTARTPRCTPPQGAPTVVAAGSLTDIPKYDVAAKRFS
jgi:hypothetical protein